MIDTLKLAGRVAFTVLDKNNKVKQKVVIHNMIMQYGADLIVDWLSATPTRGTTKYIEVGTGLNALVSTNTTCVTPACAPRTLMTGFPVATGSFGTTNGKTLLFRTLFAAGCMATVGIDEACILNNVSLASADTLCYAQITPTLTVGTTDQLQVDWEITIG